MASVPSSGANRTPSSPIRQMLATEKARPQDGHRRTAEGPLKVSGMSNTSPFASMKAKSGASKTACGKGWTAEPSSP